MNKLASFNEGLPYLRYTVPETGATVPLPQEAVHNYHDLRASVISHYKANGKQPPANLDDLVQDQLSTRNPSRFFIDSATGERLSAGHGLAHTFETVLQGTRTIVNWFMTGMRRVSDSEVARRTSICQICSFNQEPAGCTGCNMPALMGLVNTVVGGKELPGDSQLRSCVVCGCSLRAKSRIPLDVLRKHTSEAQLEKFPGHCWMKDSL